MTREVPQTLYDEVLALAADIAQPHMTPSPDVDTTIAAEAMARLLALYKRREIEGCPDPFLTEAVADCTDDCHEAVRLYRLALVQCARFPGEPTHTKRLGLAQQLHHCGQAAEAREQLSLARREAFAAGDISAIKELDELAAQLAV